jgi:hypothetical protein
MSKDNVKTALDEATERLGEALRLRDEIMPRHVKNVATRRLVRKGKTLLLVVKE